MVAHGISYSTSNDVVGWQWTPNSGLKVNAKGECEGRMQRVECQGRMQRVLNPNAQNLKDSLKLAAVVHHTLLSKV